jgi:predicted HicB family RNase H-like nuclease
VTPKQRDPGYHWVKITDELYTALEAAAKREDRSVRSLVEKALRQSYLKTKGGDQ